MTALAVASKQIIEDVFDGAAATYDRTGPAVFARFAARLVELLDPTAGSSVLDIATGTGAVLVPVSRRIGPAGRATGIDLSAGILAQAETACRAAGRANVSLAQMDAEHLGFPDAAFDAVTCSFGVFFFPALDAALAEIARVCKPGGRISLAVFSREPSPFDPAWPLFAQQVTAYGSGYRLPQRVAYTPDEAHALLAALELADLRVYNETYDVVYPDEDAVWAFQLTLGSRATILAFEQETREQFKAEYFAKLRPHFQADGLHVAVGVQYVIGERPGQ
jgi:ubiquinone/menaquinone biosynthesis C-methylase UbiE